MLETGSEIIEPGEGQIRAHISNEFGNPIVARQEKS